MNIWVNSRTKTEDYTWRTRTGVGISIPPPSIASGYDQWKFEDCVPWFGLVSSQSKATLFFGNLTTNRNDSRGRPIFVHAALQAELDTERQTLHEIVAALFVQEKQLLPKWTSFFLDFFDGKTDEMWPLPQQSVVESVADSPLGRYVYPSEDFLSRQHIAKWLCSNGNTVSPLAVGTTGRSGKGLFERVCQSKANWQVAFFSSMCSEKSELAIVPEQQETGGPKKNLLGKWAGAVAALCILAGIFIYAGTRVRCSHPRGKAGPDVVSGKEVGSSAIESVHKVGAPEIQGVPTESGGGGISTPATPTTAEAPMVSDNAANSGIFLPEEMPEAADRAVPHPEPSEKDEGGEGEDDEGEDGETESAEDLEKPPALTPSP